MAEVSPELAARARKIETHLRNQLAEVGQSRMAERLHIAESTVSRWKDGQIEPISIYLASLGLKVVPEDAKLVTKEIKAMGVLALAYMRHAEQARLIGEDE